MSAAEAAVQAAMDVVGRPLDLSERHVVEALVAAGRLHDPAEVEALRAVAEAAREFVPAGDHPALDEALDVLDGS